jgi:hypothetical protein
LRQVTADGVWLITGVQAAGKSTVADLLARQFSAASISGVASSTGPASGCGSTPSALTAEHTVRQILDRQAEAVVDSALAATY